MTIVTGTRQRIGPRTGQAARHRCGTVALGQVLAGMVITWVSSVAISGAALACGPVLKVVYQEDTPDRFTISLAADTSNALSQLSIDFTPSIGRAFVDTYYGPVQTNDPKSATLQSIDGFDEGSRRGSMTFSAFAPGQHFAFIVDLDKAIGAGNPNWLDGGEIEGTGVSATLVTPEGAAVPLDGRFDRDGVALLGNRACI